VWGGGANGSIVVWDEDCSLVKEIKNIHSRKITSFTDTGDYVWSGGDDGIILCWKKDSFEICKKIETKAGKVKALSTFYDQIWCCTWDMSIKIFDQTSYQLVDEIKDLHSDVISGIIFAFNKTKQRWYGWTTSYDSTISVLLLPQSVD